MEQRTAAADARGRRGRSPLRGRLHPRTADRIIRTRRYAVKPMSIEDAAAEIGDGSDAVIVFRNSASDTVTVLFRRPDGHLGLIEPERVIGVSHRER